MGMVESRLEDYLEGQPRLQSEAQTQKQKNLEDFFPNHSSFLATPSIHTAAPPYFCLPSSRLARVLSPIETPELLWFTHFVNWTQLRKHSTFSC